MGIGHTPGSRFPASTSASVLSCTSVRKVAWSRLIGLEIPTVTHRSWPITEWRPRLATAQSASKMRLGRHGITRSACSTTAC